MINGGNILSLCEGGNLREWYTIMLEYFLLPFLLANHFIFFLVVKMFTFRRFLKGTFCVPNYNKKGFFENKKFFVMYSF